MFGALDLLGVRIFESPTLEPKPKLKLSPSCPVSDEFRAEMDAWLLDRFGVDPETLGKSVLVPGGIAMAPSLVRALWEING